MPSITQELGSAALYSILAGSAVTNSSSSTTIFNGEIGSFPTNSITAGSWTLSGNAAVVVATAANKTDLANAIVFFQGLTATPLLGGYSTQTFTATPTGYNGQPGFVGAASSSLLFSGGVLTLDGAGLTPAPSFVILASSTIGFTTAATTINLINGALAQNVAFVAGSSLTADAHNHQLSGNLISAITTTVNSSTLSPLNGVRLLASSGAVTISGAVALSQPAGAPLPGAVSTATLSIYGYPNGIDNTQRNEWVRGTISLSGGLYPAVGSPAVAGIPLTWFNEKIKALPATLTTGPFPIDVDIKSVSAPPSGYVYQWDAIDGFMHVYQTSASGGPLVELVANVAVPTAVVTDTIFFRAVFSRND